jgi:hypothetical protein
MKTPSLRATPEKTAAETRLRGAHEWVSFEDPDEDRTWVVDVTFLTSSWQCIFGAGCQGVLTAPAGEYEQGCCSYGAHFTGEDDARRVEKAAATLTDEQWQFRADSRRKGGPLKRPRPGKGGAITTRLVDDACIFLNRPGWEGGAGCALHRAAIERGVPALTLKPDVCWQLPLRLEHANAPDGHLTSTLTEWNRHHWGQGGHEFAWWCTEAPEAFTGREPVYRSNREEITALVGETVYRLIAGYLDTPRPVALPHPAARQAKRQRFGLSSSSSSSSSDS